MLAEKVLFADTSFFIAPFIGAIVGYYFRAARFSSTLIPSAVACAFFEIIYLIKQDTATIGVFGGILVGFVIDFCIVLAFVGLVRMFMRGSAQ